VHGLSDIQDVLFTQVMILDENSVHFIAGPAGHKGNRQTPGGGSDNFPIADIVHFHERATSMVI
jgi:hypothetical protein